MLLSSSSSMDQIQSASSLLRYLDGELWEIKDALREEISKCELFQSSRCVEVNMTVNFIQ